MGFLDDVVSTLGQGVRVTSDYRTQAQQDELRRRGVTRAVHSAHTEGSPDKPGAVDVVGVDAATAQARLRAAGFPQAVAINESGKGQNQGTGAHTHISLNGTHIAGGVPSGGQPVSSGPNGTIQGLDIPAVLGETGRSEGAGPTQSNVISDMAPRVTRDVEVVRDRAQQADSVLSQTIVGLQGLQTAETSALQARNERVDGILDEQTARTQEALARIQPLFAQRRAIDAQNDKLDKMNPIERGLRSLFDANYDRDNLRTVEGHLNERIAHTGDEYSTILQMQGQLLNIVEKSYQGVTMEQQLQEAHLNQNLDLAGKSLSMGDAMLSSDLKAITTDQGIRAAQIELKNQVLGEATPGQLAKWHEQAKASPDGTVVVQGAVIGEGDLLKANQDVGRQNLSLQQAQLAAQSQNLALKEHADDQLIGTMNTTQIRSAIAAGGNFNGHPLPLDKLGQGLQNSMQRDAAVTQGTLTQGSVQLLDSMRQSVGTATRIASIRGQQLTGQTPEVINNIVNRQAPELAQMNAKLAAATDPAQKDLLAQQFAGRIQAMAQERQAGIQQVVDRWSGGDKALQPLGMAFMAGQPLNSATASAGLIRMVRTGQTFGGSSPEAQSALAAAKRVIDNNDNATARTPGQNLLDGKVGAKEKEAKLQTAVAQAVGAAYAGNQFQVIIRQAPAIAKRIGHLGAQLDPVIVRQSLTASDQDGYQRMGGDLGITGRQVEQMIGEGQGGKTWQAVKAKGGDWSTMMQRLTTYQTMAAELYLDQNHPKIGSHSAGAVFANLLSQPGFAQAAGQQAAGQGQSGFGDFVISSIGSGGIVAQVSQFGERAQDAYHRLTTQRGMRAALSAQQYNNDPVRKTTTILAAMGIPAPDRILLTRALSSIPAQAAKQGRDPNAPEATVGAIVSNLLTGPSPLASNEMTEGGFGFNVMRNAIINGKFQDPKLEAIRKRAAAKFDEYSRVTDAAFDAHGNYQMEH